MRDVDEVPVAQVVADAVAGPSAAPHAEGEVQTVVEAAPVPEAMRLVDQHTHDIESLGEPRRVRRLARVDAA